MTTGKRLYSKVAPYTKLVKAIADPHRLAILYLLAHEPLWVWQLVDALKIPENLVSHHLKALRDAGWVVRVREGRRVSYQLKEKAFKELPRLFVDTPFWRKLAK